MSPASKGRVLAALWWSRKEVYPFASDVYRRGHWATDFRRWLSTSSEYRVAYQEGYEPWVIGSRWVGRRLMGCCSRGQVLGFKGSVYTCSAWGYTERSLGRV